MTAPLHERPSIPLSWAERDRFELLMARMVCPGGVTRYYTPRARLRRLARRVACSPFAGHVRRARSYGWLLGLLIAGLACVALAYLQSLTPVTGGIR